MSKMSNRSHTIIRSALLALAALQLAGCESTEDCARGYYDHGMKLFSQHDNVKAALELRNAVKLKRDLIGAWNTLAEIDEKARNWPSVVTDLRTMVELAPNNISARLRLGKLLLLAGSSDEALKLANAGIELDDRNAELHALKAAISFKLDDRATAVGEAQAALKLDPGNTDALMVLALDRLGRGDAKGALSLLNGASVASKDVENDLGLQLLKIKLFEQTGDFKSAEQALEKLVELNPQERGYRKLLSNFYVEQGRTDEAERQLRTLAAANPSDSSAALDVVKFLYTIKKNPAAARQELNARIGAGGDVFPFRLALADMDFAEGNLADGKQLLENLISTSSSSDQVQKARVALAQMYLSKRTFEPAEALATDILHDDPHNVPALKLRASIHLERGQPDAAIADLLDALNSQPRSTDLMLLLATAYERSGLTELADKQFGDATRTSDFDANVGLEYVGFLQRRGSDTRAEDILIGLNKRRPNNIQVLSKLALIRLTHRDWAGALEFADSIRRIGNDGGIADQILGAALIEQNKYDEAIAAFQKAYDDAPAAAQTMNSLVGTFLKAHKRDQAVVFLKSVLAKNPSSANAFVLLGSIELTSGQADQAIESYQAAIKARPKDPIGYQALADLYLGRQNYDEAIRVMRSGVQLQPDAIGLHMTLARALEQESDYEAAISEYDFVLDRQPGNLIAANNLACLLLDHRSDKASFKKAQSLAADLRKSQIPQFKDTLGWVSYREGDYRTAVSLSEEAAAALPDQAAVHYHLGMGYISTNQVDKASEQLKKALEFAPDRDLSEKIRIALKKTGS